MGADRSGCAGRARGQSGGGAAAGRPAGQALSLQHIENYLGGSMGVPRWTSWLPTSHGDVRKPLKCLVPWPASN
jgi:hypothetical protein